MTHIMTLNEMKQMSTDDLIEFANSCRGHTGSNPDRPDTYFQKYANADFSYSSVSSELAKRGAKNGWYIDKTDDKDVSLNIKLAPSGEGQIKKTFRIRKSTADKWDKSFYNFFSMSVLADYALNELADRYDKGLIRFYY